MKRFVLSVALSLAFVAGAAATAQEKKSAGGEAVKLEGQVVCSLCWFEEADRTKTPYGTAENLECAVECAEKGIDAALAVREGAGKTFALYLLEDGRFDKGAKNWLAYMGKRVEVAGTLRRVKGSKNYFKVDSLSVTAGADGATAPVLQDAKVLGTEVELALRDLFGAEQRLSALRGRIVVLNFWATYCEPCRREMPDLARVQNDYAALGVQVVGASADDAAARTKVLGFIKETKLNFPVWLGATTGDMERFGLAPVLPGTVIIGRDGRIAWHKSGIIKEADVKRELDKLLAQAAREEKAGRRGGADAKSRAKSRAEDRAEATTPGAPEEGEYASTVPS